MRYRFEWVQNKHDMYIYPFLIIIEYSHADPNNYSQPSIIYIIIVHVVHNYIVVTLYILVLVVKYFLP